MTTPDEYSLIPAWVHERWNEGTIMESKNDELAAMKRRVRESARGAHPKGDMLHDAADLVERTASAATEGPWIAKEGTLLAVSPDNPNSRTTGRDKFAVARELSPENLAWMSLLGPDMGDLLARAIRHEAQAQHNGLPANEGLTVIAEVLAAGLEATEPEVVPLPEIPVTKRMTREEMLAEHELCPHGILRGMMVCPACDPEKQAAAEEKADG